jgi:alkyl hydroperoxide reductase subunit F
MLYDLIIIGAGPAGMTAAIYAARRKINFLIISLDVGGQMSWSSSVENYPGTTSVSGVELVRNFQKHMEIYGIKIKQEEILSLTKKGKVCVVKTKRNIYESKTVIIASGKSPKKLGVKGEEEFFGKGVNYCATCDAPFYKEKTVAVAGGGNSGLDASLFLSKYANKIYLLEANPKLGGETYLRDKVLADKKINVITNAKIKDIFGGNFVKGIKYEKDGKESVLNVESIFIEIGLVSKTDFTDVQKNRWGEIMVFRSTITHDENRTSVDGIFAAGDVTDIPAKQIVIAAGEGCKAALAAFDYINQFDEINKEK